MTRTVAAALNRTCFCVPVEPADFDSPFPLFPIPDSLR